ncbi:capZ-interacting protein-like [Narcine bancroftii]|uniref:capZ-interacting protein-like n=1 Tax=Narcine bancroftii TaxID=1343680 RepID=UPI003831A524
MIILETLPIQTMEEKPTSVAALASLFKHKINDTSEKDEKVPKGPIRRKPPCSLPLGGINNNMKIATDNNGDEKPPVNEASRHPKLKLKISSPHIEKLQASLLLSPTALMPGVGPRSPLKSSFSPFASPASTPESLGTCSLSSESNGSLITVDQPRESEPLQSLHKNRARPSLKRRPPSRRFRRSASDDVGSTGSAETEPLDNSAKQVEPKQSGAEEEGHDEVFIDPVQNNNGVVHSSPCSSAGEGAHSSPHTSAGKDIHSSSHSSVGEEAHSSPLISAGEKAHSLPCISAGEEAHSSPCISAGEEAHSSPCNSAEEEAHSSPCISAGEEANSSLRSMARAPLSSQNEESEVCTILNQCEKVKDSGDSSNIMLGSTDKETSGIVCDAVGSEAVVSEMPNQESKTEEMKTIDN